MAFPNILKNKGPKFTAAFIVILALAGILSTAALAGYTYKATVKDYLATAVEDFYFTSNLLVADDAEIPVYQIAHDWQTSNKATVSFELRNYQDPLNISGRQIFYTAGAEPAGGNTVTDSGAIPAGGTSGNSKTVSFEIAKPAALSPGEPLEVLVTAAATAPYKKTLRGKFIIAPVTAAIFYQVEDNAGSPLATLTIILPQSAEFTEDLDITWGEGAAPDMTNPIVIAAMAAGAEEEKIDLENRTLQATLNTAAAYELVFFKDSIEEVFTDEDITVQETNNGSSQGD